MLNPRRDYSPLLQKLFAAEAPQTTRRKPPKTHSTQNGAREIARRLAFMKKHGHPA